MAAKRHVLMTEHGHLWWETKLGHYTHSMWWQTAHNRSEYAPDGAATNWPYARLAAESALTDVTSEHPEINEEVA